MFRFIKTRALPQRAILTDDPMRGRMLVAHHLENASLITELRGMEAYSGAYKDAGAAVLSCGFGAAAALTYLNEAFTLGVKSVIYLGECIGLSREVGLRQVVLAADADAELLRDALTASERYAIAATVCGVRTCERYFLGEPVSGAEIVDFAANEIYRYAATRGLAALAVLTVTENAVTGERMDDSERQSRFHNAARLSFETLALHKPKI